MKIKNSFKYKRKPLIRRLQPRPQPHLNILVKDLSFSNNQNGTTIVKIHPSQTILTSHSLIEMIESKKESIAVNDNVHVLRDDILFAIHNFSCNESQVNLQHQRDSQPCAAKSEKPKRPTNAFILYRTALRKKIKILFPSFTNSDISKFIGAMWKAASKDVKEKYINEANQCRILHKQTYPNFEYNSKKDMESVSFDTHNEADPVENWDSYFDWCLQVTTDEAINHNLKPLESAQFFSPQLSLNVSDTKFGIQDLMDLSPVDELHYQQWNDLCNIVTDFFPEEQHTFIDEKLWDSLSNVDIMGYSNIPPFTETDESKCHMFS